ncbi:hypothetical protein BSZ37_18600 [Rubrivirga marina]|uniref:non-specific serine/threonine protein kinase n=1 Tax=Rubrivirga marina TaxID=1196024 RepID=A0A271J432_9BACT|nr:hypothetical protein BSZ37_18600 [Rubrivirga marina]
MDAPAHTFGAATLLGERVGPYRVLGELGRGGMGVVYRAEDTRLGRQVALKFLPAGRRDETATARLLVEARAAATLDHPNVCTVYEVAETDAGRPYIALACYEGETLAERLARGPVVAEEAVRIARGVAAGVAAAHARGIVHRDLKPSNVFLCEDGTPKVLDFGIAKVPDVSLTRTGETAGTLEYAAPEQARGRVDARSDVWSLGVVLYEMLTGRTPFVAPYGAAVLYAVLHEEPAPPSAHADVPPEVDAVVMRCLAKDPDRRYADAAALGDALVGVSRSDAPVSPAAEVVGMAAWVGWLRQSRRAVAVAALALVGLLGLGLWTSRASARPTLPASIHLAVLPPTPQPDGPDARAFAEGLAEELANGVRKMAQPDREMSVESVADVREHRVTTPQQAGTVLGVNLVLTGTLWRDEDRLSLTLALVSTDRRSRILDTETVEIGRAEESSIRGRALLAIAEMLEFEISDATAARLTIGTDDPEAQNFYFQGLSFLQRDREVEDVDRAIVLFQQAVVSDTAFAEAYARLGEAYLAKYVASRDTALVGLASRAAERARVLDGDNGEVLVTLSQLALATGQDRLAIRRARDALALDSTAEALRALADAQVSASDYEQAEATLQALVRRDPVSWSGFFHLGSFYYGQLRLDDARVQFERVIDLARANYQGYSGLGAVQLSTGDYDGARVAFERVLELRPSHPSALENLTTILLYQGDHKEAVRRYSEILASDSLDHETWRNLASAYWETGERAQWTRAMRGALRQVERGLAVNPNDPTLLVARAVYRHSLGNSEGARQDALSAVRLAPSDPEVQFESARVFGFLGDRKSVATALRAAKEAGHTFTGIRGDPAFDGMREVVRAIH